jgi:hypothetical protein
LGVLKDKGQRVEIRVGPTRDHRAAYCRHLSLARAQSAVRGSRRIDGLENTGFAIADDELLWIDPLDYQHQLAEAVDVLIANKVCVSVYNLPRCVLARSVWPHAVQSISDWKNAFVATCDSCLEKPCCSGFLTTGRPRYSRGLEPIVEAEGRAVAGRRGSGWPH